MRLDDRPGGHKYVEVEEGRITLLLADRLARDEFQFLANHVTPTPKQLQLQLTQRLAQHLDRSVRDRDLLKERERALDDLTTRIERIRNFALFFLFVIAATTTVDVVRLDLDFIHDELSKGLKSAQQVGLLCTTIAIAALTRFLLVPVTIRNSLAAARVKDAIDQKLEHDQELSAELEFQTDRYLRLLARASSDKRRQILLPVTTPDLVDVESIEVFSSGDVAELRSFVRGSRTSAIALAGSRGIGKSTLIRELINDREISDVAIIVPSPVATTQMRSSVAFSSTLHPQYCSANWATTLPHAGSPAGTAWLHGGGRSLPSSSLLPLRLRSS